QPVLSAHGSVRKVDGSATIIKLPAPPISGTPMPAPGSKTGKTVRCAVSLANKVLVIVTPLRSAWDASPAISVLPRKTRFGRGNEKPTSSRFFWTIALPTAAAARACAALHKPYRSTKLRADDRRLREDMLLPDVLPG